MPTKTTTDLTTLLPHDPDAEASCVGAAILGGEAVDEIVRNCGPEHFHDPNLADILRACVSVRK